MNPVPLFFFLFVSVALLVVASKSIISVKADERAVIFRLDKLLDVRSPGLVVIVPFLDKVVKVRTEQIDGSDRMTEEQLLERIAEIYARD